MSAKKPTVFAYKCHQENKRCLELVLGSSYDISFYNESVTLCRAMNRRHYSIIFVHIAPEDNEPLDLLKDIIAQDSAAPVVVICRPGDGALLDTILEPGRYSMLLQPLEQTAVQTAVQQTLHRKQQDHELAYLRHTQDIVYSFDRIVAQSDNFKRIVASLRKYAATDGTILITGETGTGKSFLSGAIHYNSPRRNSPFIKINCANISEHLLESELFGHERGSFTGADKQRIGRFEQADGGTIFLDEIGEISMSIQSKLLRVLEEKSFERVGGNKTIQADVRLIAATNRDLAGQILDGKFREDLFYRINVLPVHLPPLRNRQDCIEPMANKLLEKITIAMKKPVHNFAPEVLEALRRYEWPGNIRQLANTIERAVILEDSPYITLNSLQISELRPYPLFSEIRQDALVSHEREMLVEALQHHNWIQKRAARYLGLTPRALNYKIKKFGITHHKWRSNNKGGGQDTQTKE